jgi:uncharacterized protein (DUF2344 family)
MSNENLILIEQFCSYHNAEVTFISALKDFGLLEIVIVDEKEYLAAEQLAAAEKMIRLHYELEINLEGIDAIAHLLQRVESLQRELLAVQNRLRIYGE